MKIVFGDTGYWIAISRRTDGLHQKARLVAQQIGDVRIVTSEMVLIEYLNEMSKHGPNHRRMAVETVKDLQNDSSVEIVPVTSEQFWEAVEYYGSRLDQRWSLVDCVSFMLMGEKKIQDALAHDSDFESAGFRALLRDD